MTSSVVLQREDELPGIPVEQTVETVDDSLKRRCKRYGSLLRHFLLKVYCINTIIDGEPLKIIVADDDTTIDYIRELVPQEGTRVYRKGIINALNGMRLGQSDADLVIVGANQLLVDDYQRSGFRIVPKWVRLFLPVTEEPYSRLYDKGRQTRKYFKWMIKKAADAGFECEIMKDRAWFDRFYYEMYRPYAEHRFKERAVVYSYKIVDRAFSQGAVAFVKKDGKPVVGTVIYRQGDTLRLPHTGVAEDGVEALKDGAAFALDYYLAQHAYKEGYNFVDFGHSRPFLSDGTLKYKLNWHMDVVPDDDCMAVFAVKAPGHSPQALRFLSANPHFHLVGEWCVPADD